MELPHMGIVDGFNKKGEREKPTSYLHVKVKMLFKNGNKASLHGKASSTAFLQRVITSLHQEFSMTDLGPLNYFLGISITRNSSKMFLSQKKYATENIERANMVGCNSSRTLIDTSTKLTTASPPVKDPTLYHSLAGTLQYLTLTRPDISYAVQQICLLMHDPQEPHMEALQQIIRYIQGGTLDLGLQVFASSTTSLTAYSDAAWAGCPSNRRSTPGTVYFWVTIFSRGPINANRLHLAQAPKNPVQHQRTENIEIDIHFVRDLVLKGQVRVLHVPSRYQFADIFTKGLPSALFDEFRYSLSVRTSPAQTAGDVRWIMYLGPLLPSPLDFV
ncbi:uncharacterized mitochondrial protein AtMg00810-like [Rutidosis leptorrhynchoides]|uniref:uncharacterized mitochondrial protein AtMg00810-like n=1 Tax=Rutidosis leptorrhynchoides TaxID=125765 RepID=UPI003A999A1B